MTNKQLTKEIGNCADGLIATLETNKEMCKLSYDVIELALDESNTIQLEKNHYGYPIPDKYNFCVVHTKKIRIFYVFNDTVNEYMNIELPTRLVPKAEKLFKELDQIYEEQQRKNMRERLKVWGVC